MDLKWDDKAKEHFDKIIENLPQFHRSIAEQLVKESAETMAKQRNSEIVEDRDVVVSFFNEVPPAFKDMMKRLMSQQGVDYTQYVGE